MLSPRQPSQIHCCFRQHLPMTDIEFFSFTLALRHGSFNKDFSPFKSFSYRKKKPLLLAQVSCGWMYHRNQLSASWVWFSNEFIVDFTWTKPVVWVKKSESGEASQWTWKNGKTNLRSERELWREQMKFHIQSGLVTFSLSAESPILSFGCNINLGDIELVATHTRKKLAKKRGDEGKLH